MTVGKPIGAALALFGLLCAARAVVDPFHMEGAVIGPVLVAVALAWQRMSGRNWKPVAISLALCLAYATSALVPSEFRGDSASYLSYLSSVSFDRDFDFANDLDLLRPATSARAHAQPAANVFSVGPAVLWSPFYAATHAYLVIESFFGHELHERNGRSVPYRRATALGTVTIVMLGASLLTVALTTLFGFKTALLAVVGAVMASSVLYYTLVVPSMSHGVSFGAAAALVWAWERVRRQPSRTTWIIAGALLGVLTLCRWQGALFALMFLPLVVGGLRRRRLPWTWLAAAGGAGLAAFSPQLIAWRVQFGTWILVPQGQGFLDLSSANWVNTLFSANHGFFNWTPLMLFGAAGLLSGLRRDAVLYGAALATFAATTWVNGSVPEFDWWGGDAYGARRYSVVVPLMALGVARAIELTCRVLERRPLLAPASVIALLIAWNIGFIQHFRARKYHEMAPLEQLARDQARSLRWAARDVFGLVGGERGRAFAYELFSAEYFYTSFNRNGRIYLRSADDRYLLRGWHTPSRRIARRTFRRALYPEACVRIPLRDPFRLRMSVTARAPDGVERQTMTVTMNGAEMITAPLSQTFREIRFVVPATGLVPGENELCLQFSAALPEEGGWRVAAHVERIQLP